MFGLGVGLTDVAVLRAGAGIVDPSAGYALYLPYRDASPTYRVGATTYTDPTTLPGYSNTRAGAKSEVKSSNGVIYPFAANVAGIVPGDGYWARGALTNYLLNAGSASGLSTQSVTTTATQYTLSFIGTGTVTLSGTSTAGPLVGTGASNRVVLVFTPTAGTLTLTVTGSVTYAGLIDGNHPAGGPIIATAGATASIGADAMSGTWNPYTADTDFIMWAAVTFGSPAATAAPNFDSLFSFGATHSLGRQATGLRWYDGTNIDLNVTIGAERTIALIRRKAGKNTVAVKVGGVVTIGTETGVLAWPVTTSAFYVGNYSTGNNQAFAAIEGVYAQTGTFSDAQITTILNAA